jgi:DNA mismatch endonuclease, patch repair protein
MSQVKSKDTSPEKIVRKWIWSKGFRYRKYSKRLPGKPDICFPSKKKVIFVNGCFWHRHDCRYFRMPKSNVDFWRDKFRTNRKRDKRNYRDLGKLGWEYLVVWECEIRKADKSLLKRIERFLKKSMRRIETK